MPSLYAQYLRERTSDYIIETERGFATYRYLPDENAVYIVDIFVIPEFRKLAEASLLADLIVDESKGQGFTKCFGSVVPSAQNSTVSMKVLLAYGMRVKSATQDFILFEKDI